AEGLSARSRAARRKLNCEAARSKASSTVSGGMAEAANPARRNGEYCSSQVRKYPLLREFLSSILRRRPIFLTWEACLAIFEPLAAPNCWQPSALAAGPFAGLRGGAVGSLLTAEVEALAEQRKWGSAVSATAWFLRPPPMTNWRTQLAVLTEVGRVSVVDNTLWPGGEAQPSATVRVTLSRERAVS